MARPRRNGLKRLPRINLNIPAITYLAEASKERITMESFIRETIYVSVPGDGTVVATAENGYLRINEEDLPTLIEELTEIKEQMKIRRLT